MAQLLKVEEIDTVGFVDTGANQLADVLIWKRDTAGEEEPMQTGPEEGSGKFAALLRAVGKALKWQDADVEAAVVEAASIPQQEVGKMTEPFDRATLPEEAQSAWDALEQRAADAEAAQAKAETALAEVTVEKDDASDDDVLKGVPEAVLKRLEEAEQRVKKAEDIAKAERTERQRAEFAKVADEDLDKLPGEQDEKVDVLAAIHELPDEARDSVLTMLRSANEVASAAELFKAAGRDGETVEGSKAYDRIAARANELVEKGDHATFEIAFDHVIRTDRTLAKAYRDERARG
jgi:hypothetical protein